MNAEMNTHLAEQKNKFREAKSFAQVNTLRLVKQFPIHDFVNTLR